MVLQEPGKMTRPISKLKICHAEFSFSFQNHPTTKKIIVHLFFQDTILNQVPQEPCPRKHGIFLNYKTSLALIDRCLKSNFIWNVFKLFSYFIARKCWKQMYFFLLFYVSVALDRSTRRKTLRSSGNSDQNETLLLIRQDYLSL